jgi:ABC-2 type transport system ATP-binding protein
MEAIHIDHISKKFTDKKKGEVVALTDVSFSVEEGKIHGLLGPNGAGKSTLINLITGIMLPSAGEIEVFGVNVVKETEKSKSLIGAVPQEMVVEMAFTVEEVLYYFAGMYGVPVKERAPRIAEILESLSLSDKAKERAKNLSGGMKRRLMVAKAIMHRPKLLILDEPTAGVDVSLRQKLWELVRELNKQGTTVLFTTHYLEEAEQLCERITVVNKGRIIKDGNIKDIQKEFSKNLLHFELFERNVEHFPGVKAIGTEFELGYEDLASASTAIANHYKGNLKSLKSDAASLESIFLNLTS